MMNCMNGYFFDAALDSLSEALLNADGGAVAVFAPTGITGYAPQEPMMAALYEKLEATAGWGMTFGEAVAMAKRLVSEVPSMEPQQFKPYTAEMIAKLRISDEGQEGMDAFLSKRKPRWAEDKQ